MPMIDALLMELEQEGQTTRRVLERVPDGQLAWRPHPKSYSLGQLGLHVAATPGRVATIASQDVFDAQAFTQSEASSRAEMLDALTEGLATARRTLSLMDDSRLMATWTLRVNGKPVMTVPRIGMLRTIMLNHWYHHRGQLVVYFRLLGVPVPSVYGPTADENPFAVSEAGSAPVGAGA